MAPSYTGVLDNRASERHNCVLGHVKGEYKWAQESLRLQIDVTAAKIGAKRQLQRPVFGEGAPARGLLRMAANCGKLLPTTHR